MRLIKQQDDMNVVPHQALTVVARHNFGTTKDDIQIIKPQYEAYTSNVEAYVVYELKGLDGTWDKMDIVLSNRLVYPSLCCRTITADTVEVWAEGITSLGRSMANNGWFGAQGPRKIIMHMPSLKTGTYGFMTTYVGAKTIEEIEFPDSDKLIDCNYMLAWQSSRLYHVRFKSLKNFTNGNYMFWYAHLDKPTVLHIRDLLMEKEGTAGPLRLDIAAKYSEDIEVQAALDDIRTKVSTLTVYYKTVPPDLEEKVYREPIITQ